tara:strand:+ start:214 stop:495 length:282 start_codon:yes stop_codon:yes gene_type:complete
MAISYTLDETFTGKRTTQVPDMENEGETVDQVNDVIDIMVTFTDDSYTPDKTHTRSVNVVFDGSGDYDEDATKVRVEEVMLGVQNKFAVGALS